MWRVEIGRRPTGSLAHCIRSKLQRLALRFGAYFVLSTRERNPRWTVAFMVPLLTCLT